MTCCRIRIPSFLRTREDKRKAIIFNLEFIADWQRWRWYKRARTCFTIPFCFLPRSWSSVVFTKNLLLPLVVLYINMANFNFQLKLLLLIVYLEYIVSSEKQPVIVTPLGEIKGYYTKTRGDRLISAFTAIPFAKPPLENLRFEVLLHFHYNIVYLKGQTVNFFTKHPNF